VRVQARRPNAATLVVLAFVAAGVSTAILVWGTLSACGAVVDRSLLVAAGLIAGVGSIFAASSHFVALNRESLLIRVIVGLWAIAFYIGAFLMLNYILSLFFHCPPN
jgi:hypothetical protein